MKKGQKVQVRGTKLIGEIIATRLIRASQTDRGNYGEVLIVTVKYKDYEMEYEWTELKIVS